MARKKNKNQMLFSMYQVNLFMDTAGIVWGKVSETWDICHDRLTYQAFP